MCQGLFPWELFVLTIGRDLVLIGSGLIIRGLEKERDSAFFDASSATFEIVPTQLSKVMTSQLSPLTLHFPPPQANTALQFILLSLTLTQYYTSSSAVALTLPNLHVLIEPLWYLTAATTLGSGVQYLNGEGLKKMESEMTRKSSNGRNTKRFTWD
jgi:hypothetical protein